MVLFLLLLLRIDRERRRKGEEVGEGLFLVVFDGFWMLMLLWRLKREEEGRRRGRLLLFVW